MELRKELPKRCEYGISITKEQELIRFEIFNLLKSKKLTVAQALKILNITVDEIHKAATEQIDNSLL